MSQERSTYAAAQSAILAFGANIRSNSGGPAQTIAAATEALASRGMRIIRMSRLYSTPCMPAGSGPDYVNAICEVDTQAPPEDVLAALHAVEEAFGRTREGRWAARGLDIDLIAYGDQVCPDLATYIAWRDLPFEDQRTRAPAQLILPHPRIADRAFVLIPLAEILPDWRHPISGLTVRQMLEALPESDKTPVKPL